MILSFLRLTAFAAAISAVSLGAGCLPVNNLYPGQPFPAPSPNRGGNNLTTGLGSSAASDGAQGQCTQIDTSSPERLMCKNCYDSLLASRCPRQKSPSDCPDPAVRDGFAGLVNLCIQSSVVAGFTCTKTCQSTQVLNASSCTCASPAPAVGTGTISLVDVGQTDFGAPVMDLNFPNPNPVILNDCSKTPAGTGCTGVNSTPTQCDVKLDVAFSVRNRGGASIFANSYTPPTFAADSGTALSTSPAPNSYDVSGVKPKSLSGAQTGVNVTSTLKVSTWGSNEVKGSGIGRVGINEAIVSRKLSFGSDTPHPQMIAIDPFGNIFHSDGGICTAGGSTASDITTCGDGFFAFCFNNSGFCQGRTLRTNVSIVGVRNMGGIASDKFGNIFVSELTGTTSRLVVFCGSTSGACTGHAVLNDGRSVATLRKDTLEAGVNVPTRGLDLMTSDAFNAAYGAAIASNLVNIYYANGGNVGVLCQFDDSIPGHGTGLCSGRVGTATAGDISTATASTGLIGPGGEIGDVKLSRAGNLYIANTGAHKMQVWCVNGNMGDLCQSLGPFSGGTLRNLTASASSSVSLPGDNGNNDVVTSATATYPRGIALTKAYADDYGGFSQTVTIAGALFTAGAAHGFKVGMTVGFTTTGTLPSPLKTGRGYFITGINPTQFVMSDVTGGSTITTSGTQSGTHTVYPFMQDFNVAFTEKFNSGGLTGVKDSGRSGSVVRVICGNPPECVNGSCGAGKKAVGFCAGLEANTIIQVAGQVGVSTSGNTGNGLNSRSASFAQPIGLAMDEFKNLYVVSSNICAATKTPAAPPNSPPLTAPQAAHRTLFCDDARIDDSVRTVQLATISGSAVARQGIIGNKYSATDSNGLQGNYCMQYQVATLCRTNLCRCLILPPLTPDLEIFQSIQPGKSCP